MGDLGGKTAFISAATTAVGRACAQALGSSGAALCLADPDLDAAQHLAAAIDAPAALATGLQPQSADSWSTATARCLSEFDRLDVLVLCAGPRAAESGISDTRLEDFRAALHGVGLAAWLGQKYGVLAMRAAGRGGAVVHVTSVLGRLAAPRAAAVCAGSAGVLMSARAAALECAKAGDGIVVNTVLTGPVAGDEEHCFSAAANVPDAVLVTPQDVAAAVLFYATHGAAYMTGTEIPVDGGRSCW